MSDANSWMKMIGYPSPLSSKYNFAPVASTYGIASRPHPQFALPGAETEKQIALQSILFWHRVFA
jgi:hypothetical protein